MNGRPTPPVRPPAFFWHDYESTGTDPRRDRPSQFAGIRTDEHLEPLGDPIVAYCQPAVDRLPHPDACMITGITPQQQLREGLPERSFAACVHAALAEPNTCGVGYNSIRFDDELTRHLLYRNFYDPYAREWEHGNSRWDLIDLGRMCYALRPEGIQWPEYEDGLPSFRLEDLARANHLPQARAHDALSDVETTLAWARLILKRQPRLFEWHFRLRHKKNAAALLNWHERAPVLHASQRYRAKQGCLAMVAPLAPHPTNGNGVIVYNLDVDPRPLLELDVDALRDRIFVARADRPEDVEWVPLKTVHVNRSPALAPLSALAGTDLGRIGLDAARCERHLQQLRAHPDLAQKVRRIFEVPGGFPPVAADAELALYQQFLGREDRQLLTRVRNMTAAELMSAPPAFRDARYLELLFRYRARHWPDTLSMQEAARWQAHRARNLWVRQDAPGHLCWEDYQTRIQQLREQATPARNLLLDALQAWGLQLMQGLEEPVSVA